MNPDHAVETARHRTSGGDVTHALIGLRIGQVMVAGRKADENSRSIGGRGSLRAFDHEQTLGSFEAGHTACPLPPPRTLIVGKFGSAI